MQLTPHFADTEYGVASSTIDPRIVRNAVEHAGLLMEPIREKWGAQRLTDGYRPPAENQAAGGKCQSQHLYELANSAADFVPMAAPMQTVFDWIRLESELPFDQMIFEYAGVDPQEVKAEIDNGLSFEEAIQKFPAAQPACIHISYDSGKTPERRQALYGFTGADTVYVAAGVQ